MQRQAVVSIRLEKIAGTEGTKLLELTGFNTGNMLFTQSVVSQLKNPHVVGFEWDGRSLAEGADIIVIPAANWINGKQDWGFLAKQIEDAGLPVCCLGLGGQIDIDDVHHISEGTKRLVNTVANHSDSIGVRGEYTADLLQTLGVKNVEVLGCPSIFQDMTVPKLTQELRADKELRVFMSYTRYAIEARNDVFQRQLAVMSLYSADRVILQSEPEEIALLAGSATDENLSALALYFGCSKERAQTELRKKLRVFSSVPTWIEEMRECDLMISSRIHGCIAALLASKPALLLTHDHRTREFAELMAIPNLPLCETLPVDYLDRIRFFDDLDVSFFNRRQFRNAHLLSEFYTTSGVEALDLTV